MLPDCIMLMRIPFSSLKKNQGPRTQDPWKNTHKKERIREKNCLFHFVKPFPLGFFFKKNLFLFFFLWNKTLLPFFPLFEYTSLLSIIDNYRQPLFRDNRELLDSWIIDTTLHHANEASRKKKVLSGTGLEPRTLGYRGKLDHQYLIFNFFLIFRLESFPLAFSTQESFFIFL